MNVKKLFLLLLIGLVHGTYSRAQVNLQTGAAQSNIPLFQYNDPVNRLGVNLSLNYVSGNGVKASEIASMVGLGWELNCGGIITRTQIGEPDDQYDPYNYMETWGFNWARYCDSSYPNGCLYSSFYPSVTIINEAGFTPYREYAMSGRFKEPACYLADLEQDIFNFTFNGISGQFVIGKNKEIRCINDNNLKITFTDPVLGTDGVRTRITSFTIIDESGIKYVFKDRELSTVFIYDQDTVYHKDGTFSIVPTPYYTPPSNHDYYHVYSGRNTGGSIVNAWYLSEIINPLTEKKIAFNYDTYEVDYKGDKFVNYSKVNDDEDIVLSIQRTKAVRKKISSIEMSEHEQVQFNYSGIPREDISSEIALDNISVKYDGIEKFKWKFDFSYSTVNNGFVPAGTVLSSYEHRIARPFLQKLQKKIGSSAFPPYLFEYNPALSELFTLHQDHFGYVDDGGSFVLLDPPYDFYKLRDLVRTGFVAPNHVKDPSANTYNFALLKKIIYPEGGTQEYEYEANQGFFNGQNIYTGGSRVKSVWNKNGDDVVMKKRLVYQLSDGNSSGWGYENQPYLKNSLVIAYKTDNGTSPAQTYFTAATGYPNVGMGLLTTAVKMSTAGVAATLKNGLVAVAVAIAFKVIFDNLGPDHKTYPVEEYTNVSRISHNPLPKMYSRVEVLEQGSGNLDNGKTVYEFTSPSNYPFLVPELQIPYSSKPRFASWVYGLPKSTSVFNAAGQLLKKSVNTYKEPVINTMNTPNFLCKGWTFYTKYFGDWNGNLYPWISGINPALSGSGFISQENYYPISGHITLESSSEYAYDKQENSSVSVADYTYDEHLHLKKSSTSNSKNEQFISVYRYSYDYTLPQVLVDMNEKNMLMPVAVEQYKVKGQNSFLVGESVTEYAVTPDNDIRPFKTYVLQNAAPIAGSANDVFNSSVLYDINKPFVLKSTHSYNSSGNVEAVEDMRGEINGTVYDSKDESIVVANVGNASGSEAFFENFENNVDWSGGAFTYDNVLSHGGNFAGKIDNNRYYVFGNQLASVATCERSINISLLEPKIFQYSAWFLSGGPTGTLTLVGTRSDETQVEFNVSTNNVGEWALVQGYATVPADIIKLAVKITSSEGSGDIWFDDIRVHPKDAVMKTYSFIPLTGITSEEDDNRTIRYIEYDNLGRRSIISDKNHVILKQWCYKYAGESESCSTVFYNAAVSRFVFKKNCTSLGSIGSKGIPYSVAAGKYYSVLSQEDADKKALAEIQTLGQKYANDNGTCLSDVYVKMYYEDERIEYPNTYYNVVFKFFADAACTEPAWVNNLLVNYNVDNPCGLSWTLPENLYGSTYKINTGGPILYQVAEPGCITPYCPQVQCERVVYLRPGNHYTIVENTAGFSFNSTQSQTFTRNNCAPGNTPTSLLYTVPANKYKSIVAGMANTRAIKDLNTLGQTWVNQNATCLTAIYAKLSSENATTTFGGDAVDIVVRFYSDAACTIPVTVSSLVVNYKIQNTCTSTPSNLSATASGSAYVIAASAIVHYRRFGSCPPPQFCPTYCDLTYTLSAGSGYIIVN